jgi:hypothetical protein
MMDDNDLLASVREDFSGVRLDTPAEAILAEGASLRRRRRRRLAYGSGATALAAAAAVSGAALMPGAASAGGTHDAQLAAWTVREQPNGVYVTLRGLRNLQGLEQKLRADGVPAEVATGTRYPAACVDNKAMRPGSANSIFQLSTVPGQPGQIAILIHPAAIPPGTKLLIINPGVHGWPGFPPVPWGGAAGGARSGPISPVNIGLGLVYANGHC